MEKVCIIQGKVEELRDETSERGFKFAYVRLSLPDGREQQCHLLKGEVNFEKGDVIRSICAPVRPGHRDGVSLVNQQGIEHPNLFNVSNLGKVDVGSAQRTHFEFGERLTVKVVEHCGRCDAMDWLFHFAKVQLEDGSTIKMTFPDGPPRKDSWIQGTIGNSVFSAEGDEKGSPGGLMSAGFGNLGGMPLLFDVREVPEPVIETLKTKASDKAKRPTGIVASLRRVFGCGEG